MLTEAGAETRPNSSAWRVSTTIRADRKIVLVGMHPQFRQVPPRRSLSTSTTSAPKRAASNAAE